jgi:nitrate reductase gamma subunit
MLLILIQLALGFSTIAVALAKYRSGCGALPFMWWAQSIATLKPAAAVGYVADAPRIFKLHMINGMTILLVFPFTRLVNICGLAPPEARVRV